MMMASLPDDASPPNPFLPPPLARAEGVDKSSPQRARSAAVVPTSAIQFFVHPGLDPVMAHAAVQEWNARGWTVVTIPWLELRYTTDGWKTTCTLTSTDVPCPIVNGFFYLPRVKRDTEVEFAVHVGLSCRAPTDAAGSRAEGSVWLNNGGQNYRQLAR